jgi:hypothetical protein
MLGQGALGIEHLEAIRNIPGIAVVTPAPTLRIKIQYLR